MAVGDIGGAVINTLVLDTGSAGDVSKLGLVHMTGNLFACAYHMDGESNSILKTFTMDSGGNFSTVIDSFTFDTGGSGGGPRPHMVKAAVGVVAIFHGNAGIQTIAIDSAGNISGTIDTQSLTGMAGGSDGHIIASHHGGNLFIVVYEKFSPSSVSEMSTFTISSGGIISAIIDSQQMETTAGTPDVIHAIDDIYAVVLENTTSDDVKIETFAVDSSGNIGSQLATFTMDPEGARPSIQSDELGVVFVAYEEGSTLNAGRFRVYNIQTDGTIDSQLDSANRADLEGCHLAKIGLSKYLLCAPNLLESFALNGSGIISSIDSLAPSAMSDDFEAAYLPFSLDMWAIGYSDESATELKIISVSVESDLEEFGATITGTITDTIDESAIRAGGDTLVITLDDDTWITAGSLFDAQRQPIIDGIDSAQGEAAGWDAVVKAGLSPTDVVRSSSTVVTITLPVFAGYDISATETITVTIPAAAMVSAGGNVQGLPTIAITALSVDAAITGTVIGSNEEDTRAGGKTIIVTLSNDTWVAAGATFNAERQGIIDGLDSAQVEGTGWNAEVRDKEVVGAVVRTSATVVTITLTAAAAYDTTASETITVTIPASALVSSGSPLVAAPTFVIATITAVISGNLLVENTARDVRVGGKTIIITLTGATWHSTIGADNSKTQDLIDGFDSAQSEGTGWNAEVRDKMTFRSVVRTSDTVVTITLPGSFDYEITASETITLTVPTSALS